MEKIDSDLKDLNLRCYYTDFEYALLDLAAFELKYQDQTFSDRIEENIILCRRKVELELHIFNERVGYFKKMFENRLREI